MSGRRGGRNIAYTKQDEPAFIRQFKEKVGYKEEPDIEEKRAAPRFDDSDEESDLESDDYKPQVIVLKKGDLTAEEAEKHFAEQVEQDKEDDEEDVPSGRIVFKKPTKRVSDDGDSGALVTSSVKRPKKTLPPSGRTSDKDGPRAKKLDNTKLLSFDAEEEPGDDD